MTIDNDWQFKAEHWEREVKRLISENNSLKNELLLRGTDTSETENIRNVLKEYVCECTGICHAEAFGGPCGRAAYAALNKA